MHPILMTNYYYCLGCRKIIVSVNRDYGPRCPECRKKQPQGKVEG